ncbi:MAG: hypothetical protein WCB11_28760 [Terriglobales bacterium]
MKWSEKTYGVKRVAEMGDGSQKPKHSGDTGTNRGPHTPEHLKALDTASTEEEQLYWKFFLMT